MAFVPCRTENQQQENDQSDTRDPLQPTGLIHLSAPPLLYLKQNYSTACKNSQKEKHLFRSTDGKGRSFCFSFAFYVCSWHNDPLVRYWAVNRTFKNGEKVGPFALWCAIPWAVAPVRVTNARLRGG
jgi:hypothetical protein